MDAGRIGGDVRLLRRRRGWSQRRLAKAAHVSRWAVATLESGRGASLRLDVIDAVTTALGGYLSVRLLYQGEGLDRLRDQAHAELVERIITILRDLGWEVATEVSFNNYGERGSIDVLAFHRASRTLLVIEVKSVVPDVGGMLATLDRKVRLAADIGADRGWTAVTVGRLLVVPEDSTVRRRVRVHESIFSTAFPERNVAVNRWLRSPLGSISGLLFLPMARGRDHPASGRSKPRPQRPGPSTRS